MNDELNTRFCAPPLPRRFVSRPRLLKPLNLALAQPLALVSAPLGYGKTVLLAEWTHTQEVADNPPAVAWVSLHESDDDPHRFWSHLVEAIDRLAPGGREITQASPASFPAQATKPDLTALHHKLSRHTRPVVLILDDYHFIGAHAIHAGLSLFVERLPAQCRVVIASETDPPLPLAAWRVDGRLIELRAADLRFTHEETLTFLVEQMKPMHAPSLKPGEIAALETRTGGRAAGLQIATLSLQGRGDLSTFIAAFTARPGDVVTDLAEDILERQPPAISSFLLQTSILDRLCGSLCDHVTAGPDGQKTLEQLEWSNLFTVRLDEQRHWYQYHRLFADVLRNRLFHTHHDLLPALHRRASDWYAQHRVPDQAIRHALAANDYDRAARLIRGAAPELVHRGQIHTVLGWMGALPEAVLRGASSLCILHAQALSLAGHPEAALRRLLDARSAPDCGPGQQAAIETLRAGFSSQPRS